jgi:hypothetical protein
MAWVTETRSVLDRPLRLKEFEVSKLKDYQLMKVARLSVLSNGRLYLPGDTPVRS